MRNHRPRTVLVAICLAADVDMRDMLGTGRRPDVVRARLAYSWLCRRRTLASFPEIARETGRRNWSGVIEQRNKAERLIARDDSFADLIDRAERLLDGKPDRIRMTDYESEVYKALVMSESVAG